MSTATVTRRIPNFRMKLQAALDAAGLPDGVKAHCQHGGDDPDVYLEFEYVPHRYAKAFTRTDARNRDDLDPRVIVERCRLYADRWSRDPRYTQEARERSGQLADILAAWLTESAA
jgi:transposase